MFEWRVLELQTFHEHDSCDGVLDKKWLQDNMEGNMINMKLVEPNLNH